MAKVKPTTATLDTWSTERLLDEVRGRMGDLIEKGGDTATRPLTAARIMRRIDEIKTMLRGIEEPKTGA